MSELTQQEQQFFETGGESPLEASQEPAETQEAQPQAEVTEQPQAAQEQQEAKESRTVPLAVLMEERNNAKALKAQLAQLQQQQQAWERRFAEINDRLTPKQQVPEFTENPAENLKYEVTQTRQELAAIKQQQEQAAREAQFATWYQGQAQQFAAQTPDFFDAYNAFLTTRQNELSEQGMTPQQIAAKIRQEEQILAVSAAQLGLNPAQMVYQTALAKGYKQTPKKDETAANQEKLAQVANGIKSSKSLSQVAGKPPANLTAEYVIGMSDAEFKKWNMNWDENVQQLAG